MNEAFCISIREVTEMGTNRPRLLITGGAGFVLSNLVHHWLTIDSTATAVIFDQKKAWDLSIQAFLGNFVATERLCFYDGDVSSSESWTLLEKIHGTQFTHVVAGAALTPTAEEEKQMPLKIIDVNLQGILKCFEFVRLRLPNIHRCVHISSDAVLGIKGLNFSPDTDTPSDTLAVPSMSLYALSKLAGEAAAKRWKELYGMDIVSVRFSDVYGRLDRDTGARNRHNAPYWVCRKVLALENETSLLQNEDSYKATNQVKIKVAAPSLDSVCWDMIAAPSVASGVAALLKSPSKPKRHVYHIALGRTPPILEVIESALGRKMEPDDFDKIQMVQVSDDGLNSATKGDIDIGCLAVNHWLMSNPMDIGPMKDEFGWYPEELKTSLKQYMDHLRESQEHLL